MQTCRVTSLWAASLGDQKASLIFTSEKLTGTALVMSAASGLQETAARAQNAAMNLPLMTDYFSDIDLMTFVLASFTLSTMSLLTFLSYVMRPLTSPSTSDV